MTWIPAGTFLMGTDDPESYQHEGPAHEVRVTGFYMDVTEVTNQQFKTFVEATGYLTTAEKKPDWEQLSKQLPPGTPQPKDDFAAGSLVFSPPSEPVMAMEDYTQWWKWVEGADWKHPEGTGSNIDGKDNHPVVHVSWDDAMAYCEWAGKRLATEAEWEYASRGGVDNQRYAWGNEFRPAGKFMANTFQGSFPTKNTGDDGFAGSSPVKSFPPNAYGLYDMIGNVWEWTHDYYHADYYQQVSSKSKNVDPSGAEFSFDPNDPYGQKRVTRGGSFLCAMDYCVNYRPSARQATAFDSGSSNIGFRCVKDGR